MDNLRDFDWFCEPDRWDIIHGNIEIYTDAKSDFWQRTHYGFRNDNAHFFYSQVTGDFEMQVRVTSHPLHKYDQAGLCIRIDAENWIKTSVEFIDKELSFLGAVVTNLGYSDWSTQPFKANQQVVDYKIVRDGADFEVYAKAADAKAFQMIRICHLHKPAKEMMAGIYACSPTDAGMKALFNDFQIQNISR
jgi:uncharacterized protein